MKSSESPSGEHSLGRVSTSFFHSKEPFELRCGDRLEEFTLAYETYGSLNADRSNAILVFHAMTGSQHAAGFNPVVPGLDGRWTEEMFGGWWENFIGPGLAIDTDKYFVVCANYLGGCYGSTGPASPRHSGGERWGADFPPIRISDIVDSQMRLLDHLGIETLHAAVGASIGGFLTLSLATRYPERVRTVVPIATGPSTTMLQRLMNFEQIAAIEQDPEFANGHYTAQPLRGLASARRTAHKTFVSLHHLRERARGELVVSAPPFGWYQINHPVESYMFHQGEKFAARFDANSYLRILDAWQWFDLVAEGHASSYKELFSRCRDQRYLVFSIDSDGSFEPAEQGRLVHHLEAAEVPVTWISVHSSKGHDAFLLEPALFTPHLSHILAGKE
ncbi:homoserine O-acetyltransferase MetX [Terrimicrobium sacchariphilum]|uniref:homoserine O-acetyltransferase MetX n=1 Tax=Terrimicrobium sacchariphilum TaxID=690879 RepID=UPI00094667BC|nr:homoserine O-acetyltransferase [Terrimicrobium sacchariphilum]